MTAVLRITFAFILLSFFEPIVHQCAAQTVPPERFTISHWTMDDGLPQSSANDILQTKDGYLWLATFGGLVRYNGESFTVFDRSNSNGMRSDRILSLFEDRSGALWCSTEDGFLRFQHGKFTTFMISDGKVAYSPLMVEQDARGILWVSAHGKPYRFNGESFEQVSVLTDSTTVFKAVAEKNGAWIAHGRELLKTLGDTIVLIKDFSKTLKNNIQGVKEYPAGSGNIWIVTSGDGLIRYSNGTIRTYRESDGLPSRFLRRLFVDRMNTLWVCGFNGISRWTGERFVPLRTVNGGSDKEFNVITQDVEGNYWTGTPANGLFRLRPSVIRTIGPDDGLMEGKMLSLARRKDGSLLFGTNCGGVYEWRNGRATYSKLNKHLVNLCVWSILEDSKGRVWTGSQQLSRFDDISKKGIVYDSVSGFTGLNIFALMEERNGKLWIGCSNGLYSYDRGEFIRYTDSNGLPEIEVRTIVQDLSGTIWVGTLNGVFRLSEGKFRSVDLTPTDSEAAPLRSKYIRAIYRDSERTMWFGTYGGGIVRLKGGKCSIITTNEGLFDNIVSHIIEDERGYFWMGSNRGLFRVSKEDLNKVADNMLDAVQSSVYGTSDGMRSAETNGGFQPSIVKDTAGDLYVPTVNGVVVVSTRKVEKNEIPPPVVIERIVSEGKRILLTSAFTISSDSATIQFDYVALSFADPKKIRFKYRLIGFDEDWIDAGLRRSAYYTKIPPGTHSFQVIAANNDGVWNMSGASIQLTVLPPFWMTWWFRLLVVIFFLSSGPSIYYLRVTQLKKDKRVQQQFAEQLIHSQEQERRRIAMDLHDGLGQQILIIKNRVDIALKTVSDPEKTADQLREIAISAASSLNDVRSISYGLRPINLEKFGLKETLMNLCEQIQETTAIEWAWHIDDIDGIIPREKEINFYRMMQEGIKNIMQHSSATQASMMIRRSDDQLTAFLWDNGKGFDTGLSSMKEGLGLVGIRERAKILGGSCTIKSQSGEGTTLMIILQIHNNG